MNRKTGFFEGWSWFKFNNVGLVLVMTLKIHSSLTKKGLKFSFQGYLLLLYSEKLQGKNCRGRGAFCALPCSPLPPSSLNRVNSDFKNFCRILWVTTLSYNYVFVSWYIPERENKSVTLKLEKELLDQYLW